MEYLDIVDKDDKVIGVASRDDIYKYKHIHRIIHVLVFDSDGKMALQKRSKDCSYCPNHWSTSVGGHVISGETPLEGAIREYKEELGVSSKLELFVKELYEGDNGLLKFIIVYKTEYNGKFDLNLREVSDIKYFSIKEIERMINSGEKFHPELLYILKKYYLK